MLCKKLLFWSRSNNMLHRVRMAWDSTGMIIYYIFTLALSYDIATSY